MPAIAIADIVGTPAWESGARYPAIPFDKAFAAARLALGKDESAYYCIHAGLDSRSARAGWKFIFGKADDTQQTIIVDERGQATLSQRVPPEFKSAKKIGTLDDAERVLSEFFASHGFEVAVKRREGDEFTICTKTRKYSIHAELEDGDYAVTTEEVDGPLPGGLIVKVRQDAPANFRKLAEKNRTIAGVLIRRSVPYYESSTRGFQGTDDNHVLVVTIENDRTLPYEIKDRAFKLFQKEIRVEQR